MCTTICVELLEIQHSSFGVSGDICGFHLASKLTACLIVFSHNDDDFLGDPELAETTSFRIMAVNSPFNFQPVKD